MRRHRLKTLVLAIASALAASACATGNILHEYDYRGQTLAVASDIPARPDVLSGSIFDIQSSGDPLRDVLRAGARVVREVEAREVQERLDSAATRMDVGYVLEDNTLDRAARYLGAEPISDERRADYILELIVIDYGVDAEGWDATAHFFIEADAALLHAESGSEIWRAEVGARDPIGPAIFGGPSEIRDLVTATMLSTLTVDEMVEVLEALADFAARVVTDELRDDLRDSRRR